MQCPLSRRWDAVHRRQMFRVRLQACARPCVKLELSPSSAKQRLLRYSVKGSNTTNVAACSSNIQQAVKSSLFRCNVVPSVPPSQAANHKPRLLRGIVLRFKTRPNTLLNCSKELICTIVLNYIQLRKLWGYHDNSKMLKEAKLHRYARV